MDLIANATFRLQASAKDTSALAAGIYRVILNDARHDVAVIVLIAPDEPEGLSKGGRRPKPTQALKRPRKKPSPPLIGRLIWIRHMDLRSLADANVLYPITVQRPGSPQLDGKAKKVHDDRIAAMSEFLDLPTLQESIVMHKGLGGMVKRACANHSKSPVYIYKQWSNMCRWGLDERGLSPRFDRCGAPGVRRPCDPPAPGSPARKKAGRKTKQQRIDALHGVKSESGQPPINSDWIARITVADKRIPSPKPSWPERIRLILSSAFCGKAVESEGKIVYTKPSLGEYPNNQQIKRVLTEDKTRLERLLERTTKRHFESTLRGLRGRNWRDVAGPGHTWVIDSTVGDIYLRSSLNRQWIVGRPIVYVIVDVWSTAVVGFYVCLTGPSWNTAKVALFNAAADPTLVGEMWGYTPILSLTPHPSLCYALMCDRGEYLSMAHRTTALKYLPMTSYAAPYRGDLKGLVEVLHRIEKDAQFVFVPGAMDFRRAELELRKVDPSKAVFTVREYVHYLYEVFTQYNLSADRSHRVDAHMLAAGVFPSPAGLWRFGHEAGLGFRRHIALQDLITDFLPSSQGSVRRDGVVHAKCHYSSHDVEEREWTAIARNFGGWKIPVSYYPGSMSSIWTPAEGRDELLKLTISDQSRASPELTVDEWSDSLALETIKRSANVHQQTMTRIDSLARIKQIIEAASQLTTEAIAQGSGAAKPTMSEARAMEVAADTQSASSERKSTEEAQVDAMELHQSLMESLLAGEGG